MAKKRRRKRRPEQAGSAGPPGDRLEHTYAGARRESDPSARSTGGPDDPAGPPPPPWGSFPLSELVVLAALIFLVGGLFVSPPRGAVMIGAGLVLGSLAGLELSWREHFAGYRSHTLLLAGAAGIAVIAALFALDPGAIPPGARLIAGVAATGLAAAGLLRAFRRRSGGELFKVR